MLLLVIFILAFNFACTTTALQCLSCNQTLSLLPPEAINTNRSECKFVDVQDSSCSLLLHVQYSKNEASVRFGASPADSLILSNAAITMTNTTTIWLDKIKVERSFHILCFNNDTCNTDAISNIYAKGNQMPKRPFSTVINS